MAHTTPTHATLSAVHEFADARYGLFLHYGLYSLLADHEWVQFRRLIPVDEYAKLAEQFTAERFDANDIAKLAVDAGMKYINLTTRHHDSFCLWQTRTTKFNASVAPLCRRDLVEELAQACRDHGLKFCMYISHGRDWRHPHAPNNDRWGSGARPTYAMPQPQYATGSNHNLQHYNDYITRQITELFTNYGPVTAIWLDGIATPLQPRDDKGNVIEHFDPRTDGDVFECQKLYDHIHKLQPDCLVSYKQGYLGTEDFFAPEHRVYNRFGEPFTRDKPGEVCTTMTPHSWGYSKAMLGKQLTADQVWDTLTAAANGGCNLLLNTGPMPDGSIVPAEAKVLREVGQRIRAQGLPSLIYSG